jgi:predicted TIM-barrel fold metal-dependent hydrolase
MNSMSSESGNEVIIDPDQPIVDSQFHLFDRPAMRYLFEDYVADVRVGHNIIASVYVETQAFFRTSGPELMRPIGEIEFANGIAAMSDSGIYGPCRIAAAIVGHADLQHGEAVSGLLDHALAIAPQRLRGIRQITLYHDSEAPYRYMSIRPPRVAMDSTAFRAGFAQLARRGLTFDAAIFHTQMPELSKLAASFPDTTIVLNHMGYAMALDRDAAGRAEVFNTWRDDLRKLARQPNVYCKVGGLGMPPWGFGFEKRTDPVGYVELANTWKPYVETAIEAFGAKRCMMESNFPPDRRSCSFASLWNALKLCVGHCSVAERAALFHDTAARVYRMALPTIAQAKG